MRPGVSAVLFAKDVPPAWADADSQFFLGFDPEGNVFGCGR
jgi:hypothetical protein